MFFEEGDEGFDIFKLGQDTAALIQQNQQGDSVSQNFDDQDTNGMAFDGSQGNGYRNSSLGVGNFNANIDEVLDQIKDGDYLAQEVKKDYRLEEFEMEYSKTEEGCIHEILKPKGWVNPIATERSAEPPLTYSFKLDPFQQRSIDCIEANESVLVSAHTSAGKTAIAEYAIAKSLRDKQRVIYTSPIKALSNQKYRELSQKFGDVGLITGDVTQNQNSSCLVMTTEILRSMLYRGSEIAKEIAWVIFDEVHYMRDRERGVVWEETIILCSENIRYVFLSATIPNAKDFAQWICKIKKQPCHVVYTDHRPTPLEHYLFPAGANGIYLTVDKQGKFRDETFKKALSSLNTGAQSFIPENKKKRKDTEGTDLNKVLKLVIEKKYDPVIVFSFSKKEVEAYALSMTKFDLTNDEEKETIETLYNNAMSSLATEDRELPQIKQMIPILKKGIGIHHGGFLPIVKEIIEIMFQMGLLKILFSTETFAMGLNMPARTVVFTAVRKFDGEEFRWLTGGEYIQMSGRAGRRGIDDRGITILMVDEKMEPDVAKGMLKGQADALHSSFYLNYNMLINSMKIEDTDPEFIIRRSFHQFEKDLTLPDIQSEKVKLQERVQDLQVSSETEISKIYSCEAEIERCNTMIREIMTKPSNLLKYLSIGRMVKISYKGEDWGWGAIINFSRRKTTSSKKASTDDSDSSKFNYIIDVMLHIKIRQSKGDKVEPAAITDNGEFEIIPMLLECICEISSVVLVLPSDLVKKESKSQVRNTFKEVFNHFEGKLPLMDPIKDMKLEDPSLKQNIKQIMTLKAQVETLKIDLGFEEKSVVENLEIYKEKQKCLKKIDFLQEKIDQAGEMILKDDLSAMKRVMRRLGILDKHDIVQDKGRVAGEISSGDELIITELLLSGFFNSLSSKEIAAILTIFIHDESGGSGADNSKVHIKDANLARAYTDVVKQAQKMYEIYVDCKLNIDKDTYLNGFKPQMIDVTLKWCEGASFAEVCKISDLFEGSIIRCLRRLDELLKEMSNCAKVMGNQDLQSRFDEAGEKLRRGIVFAASLYLQRPQNQFSAPTCSDLMNSGISKTVGLLIINELNA